MRRKRCLCDSVVLAAAFDVHGYDGDLSLKRFGSEVGGGVEDQALQAACRWRLATTIQIHVHGSWKNWRGLLGLDAVLHQGTHNFRTERESRSGTFIKECEKKAKMHYEEYKQSASWSSVE